MGSSSVGSRTFLIYRSWSYPRFGHSDVATKSDESDESHEGSERCQGRKGHDGDSRLQVRGRIHWFESEGRKGNYGGLGGRGSRSVEKTGSFKIAGALNLKLKSKP